ncbi:MAG: alpha/beta hydrolase-fold protein [Lacipirellulaceae bacterium]
MLALLTATSARSATLQLKDGSVLAGDIGQTAGVADDPLNPSKGAGGVPVTPIVVVDDGLRRTFLHKTAVREVLDQGSDPTVKIRVWQNVASRGSSIGVVGQALRITPLDKFGRRTFEMPTAEGPIAVIQGVTEVTPVYVRLQGLVAEPNSYLWDQRLATSSLPREVLATVLGGAVPRNDLDARLEVVRLYLQSERYQDARFELERVQKDFEGRPEAKAEGFDEDVRQLRQLAAKRLLDEVQLRQRAGQHRLVRSLLTSFPADGVPGETLQRVAELLDEVERGDGERADAIAQLERAAAAIADAGPRRIAERAVAEIRAGLSEASAERLTAFRQLSRGDGVSAERLAAVAISSWIVGSARAVDELSTALELVDVRDNVRRYLVEPNADRRASLLVEIRDSPWVTVQRVADILRLMAPPLPLVAEIETLEDEPSTDETGDEGPNADEPDASPQLPAGCHVVTSPTGARAVVQLPPEYDPLRRYPAIVALAPIAATPASMLDFWAGSVVPTEEGAGARAGQAMRRGYVVIAIDWAPGGALAYGYTPREHAAVLGALREAMRRVSIDADRVYLTGHGEGGDAAWDVAVAHPDAWAGVMPFLARTGRYVTWYTENAKHVAWRFVNGELDAGKVAHNATEFDAYLKPQHDAVVVEYRGRGYEPLGDELQSAFDWMERRKRRPPPEEFEVLAMRPSDNYFWWVEAHGLPAKSMVAPAAWPPPRGTRGAPLRGRKLVGDKLAIFARVEGVTVWLSPELVDFGKPIEIEWNGRRLVPRGETVEPDLEVLLEDARTRADRVRPYWARVEGR